MVARLDTGKEGPTIAMRFDIDANGIEESKDEDHRPNRRILDPKMISPCMHVATMVI